MLNNKYEKYWKKANTVKREILINEVNFINIYKVNYKEIFVNQII